MFLVTCLSQQTLLLPLLELPLQILLHKFASVFVQLPFWNESEFYILIFSWVCVTQKQIDRYKTCNIIYMIDYQYIDLKHTLFSYVLQLFILDFHFFLRNSITLQEDYYFIHLYKSIVFCFVLCAAYYFFSPSPQIE